MDLLKDTQNEDIWIIYLALKFLNFQRFLSDWTYHWIEFVNIFANYAGFTFCY